MSKLSISVSRSGRLVTSMTLYISNKTCQEPPLEPGHLNTAATISGCQQECAATASCLAFSFIASEDSSLEVGGRPTEGSTIF